MPELGVSKQPSKFITVDLPEPLGPMTATNSPSSTRRSIPESASKAEAPCPYVLVTPSNSISASSGSPDLISSAEHDRMCSSFCWRHVVVDDEHALFKVSGHDLGEGSIAYTGSHRNRQRNPICQGPDLL